MNVQCRWQHTSGDDGQMSPWPPLWPHPCSDCLVAMIPVCVRWPSFCLFHQIMWIFLFLTRLTLTLKIRTRIFVFHLHIFILMTLFIMYLFPLHFYWFPSMAVVPGQSLWWFSCCEIWVLVAQPIQQKPVKLGPLATGAGKALILQEWVCVRRRGYPIFLSMKHDSNIKMVWTQTLVCCL